MDTTDEHRRELLRIEVSKARRASAFGSVRLTTPVGASALAGVGLLLIVALGCWLALGHYTRRVHVSGTLAPVGGLAPLESATAGIITRVLVQEGDTVSVGTPLLMVTQEESAASTGDTRKSISAAIQASQTSLAEDIQLTSKSANDQQHALTADHASLQRQLVQIDDQIALWRASSERQGALLDKIHTKLASGVVSDVQLQEMEAQQDNARGQVSSLQRERLQVTQQIAENEAQQRQVPLDAEQKRGDFQRKILDAKQVYLQTEADRLVIVRSQINGTVANLLVHPGQSVTAGRELLTLVPTNAQLQAELLVPSHALGFLAEGDHVVLHYGAYAYQKFGPGQGTVQRIGKSAMRQEDTPMLTSQQGPDPMYRVIVSLDRQTVSAYGHDKGLTSGMALDADIMVERRSMLEWVFEPLYGMAKR
ncbi:HlyD family secretion protein [Luteibacter yeojuensis]|uniref:HlyD family secretion protein n=1 Tax=Luteibacter yeojuensis TaxID=345309 RepID=UPI0018DBB8FB|nr:HlyD family efflux transporter periplasmic adaptor subunit [Luteibacter yeojuensis]